MDLLKEFDGTKDWSGKRLMLNVFCGMGDLLWRTSLFCEIKRRNPKLYLVITSRGPHWKLIYRDNPYIDELREEFEGNLKLEDIDYYVEDRLCPHVLSSYSRKMHAIDALGVWAGFEIYDKSYWYETTKDEKEWAKAFFEKYKAKGMNIIGVVLKASTWVRTMPVEETIRIISFLLYDKSNIVVVMDNNKFDIHDDRIINMAGGYNVREIAAVTEQLDLLITPDSGIMHFGGHFRIPTIAIFGGTSPESRIKYYPTVSAIAMGRGLNCWPCFIHAHACKYGAPGPCLARVKAEDVMKEINKLQVNNL